MATLESLAELARVAQDVYLVRHQNHVALFVVAGQAGVIEMLDLNMEGMLRWRAGERLGHFLGSPH